MPGHHSGSGHSCTCPSVKEAFTSHGDGAAVKNELSIETAMASHAKPSCKDQGGDRGTEAGDHEPPCVEALHLATVAMVALWTSLTCHLPTSEEEPEKYAPPGLDLISHGITVLEFIHFPTMAQICPSSQLSSAPLTTYFVSFSLSFSAMRNTKYQ